MPSGDVLTAASDEPGRRPTAREIAGILRDVGAVLLGLSSVVRSVKAVSDAVRERRQGSSGGTSRRRPLHRPLRRKRQRKNTMNDTVTLYRPVGRRELELIAESGYTAFPPRLPEQPIFYPVLNEPYATQIARDWNTKDAFSGHYGAVLRFAVRADFLAAYEVKTVGASQHQEYWIPAADLPAFNAAIVGPIEVVAEFHGVGGGG
jgi:hypothetical protein